MNQEVKSIIESLENIVETIRKVHPQASSKENINKPLHAVLNTNFPPISKQQIFDFIHLETKRLENLNTSFEEEFLDSLDDLATYIGEEKKKIEVLFTQSNAQFFDKIVLIITIVNLKFQQYLDWEHVDDLKKIPREVKQRISTIQNSLNEVEESTSGIEDKVEAINDAYNAATELPVLLRDLNKSRADIDLVKTKSNENLTNIQNYKSASESDLNTIKSTKQQAEKLLEDAKDVLKQMHDKLTISTGIGLAYAFNSRSKELKIQSYFWTAGFIASLLCIFFIAFNRFNYLNGSITQTTPISYVIIQIIISLISLSAPVWFALVSSKQIHKLFTLSEDYAYKASISASYEGYRQEAYEIDSELVKKLLNTALTKVDEAPLRLVGNESSSSPFEEFINQPKIKELIEMFPETKDWLFNVFTKSESSKKMTKKSNEQDENLTETSDSRAT